MSKPLISVITVCYNAAETIEKTIKSVVEQDFDDYEYVIIDGASTDGTLDILKQYEHQIAQIIIEKDTGIYDAMNKAMLHAKGQYINFLNAGDYYADAGMLSLVARHLKDGVKLLYGNTLLYSEQDKSEKIVKSKLITQKIIKKDFYLCHQTMFVSKDIAPPYDLQYKIKADYKWLIEIGKELDWKEIKKLDIPLVYYLEEGFSSKSFYTNLRELIRLHRNEFGIAQVIKNVPVYLYRTARHIKNSVFR